MTKINSYPKNQTVRVWGSFTNAAGAATDPTAVWCQVITPGGTQTNYAYGTDAEVVRSTTGIYYLDIEGTESGTWHYRWYSTGGRSGDENEFEILESNFTDPA